MKAETIDLAALKDLLRWARQEKIAISQVSIGNIALAMTDLQLGDDKRPMAQPPPPSDVDPYERYGGSALKDALEKAGIPLEPGGSTDDNTTYEDDDDA